MRRLFFFNFVVLAEDVYFVFFDGFGGHRTDSEFTFFAGIGRKHPYTPVAAVTSFVIAKFFFSIPISQPDQIIFVKRTDKVIAGIDHYPLSDIPALNILDSINNWGTLAGFPLFTIGIVCGLFYAKPVYGSTMNGDPKEIISILIWVCFAFLFYKRIAQGWRGRKPARLMVAIFGLSLFSIVVVNLFMNSHHAFVRI